MAMNMAGSSGGGRRGRRRAVMAEINVTPMVDVMLVLLIIFMVSAPLLTVGVPLDLPQTQAKSLDQDKNPLTLSVNLKGQVFLNDTEIGLDDLVAKLKAITEARGGLDERIFARGAAAGIDADRYYFSRSALQDHRRHQDRRKGQAQAAGRESRRRKTG